MDAQTVIEQVKQDGVEFISLQFADLLGVVKEIIIPVREFPDALADGVWFDGSSIEGFARIQESDLFLKPDPETYAVVPWLDENGKTARLICDIYGVDGKPYGADPRFILKRTVARSVERGFVFNVGPEPEFYLFKNGDGSKTAAVDGGGYFDLASHEGYRVIREIVGALKKFGINVEASHHEVGQGQYEIDFNYGPALAIADRLVTLKYTVKRVAQMHGLCASFIPKPIMGRPGSGLHVHQSLFDPATGDNRFFSATDRYRLSSIAYQFLAGQIRHIKAMCAILCPIVNSYKRLISGFEAPVYITWAGMNRSALIRVPQWFAQKPKGARIELRCPDPSSNPYLAFAVMLTAGLDGIDRALEPPAPVEENVYQLDDESLVTRNIDTLPAALVEALDEMRRSDLVRGMLGDELFNKYLDIKTREWNEFKSQVTAWELDKYLTIY